MTIYIYIYLAMCQGCPSGVMVKALDCGIIVSELELPLRYSNKCPWKRYVPPYPPSYGLNSITAILL